MGSCIIDFVFFHSFPILFMNLLLINTFEAIQFMYKIILLFSMTLGLESYGQNHYSYELKVSDIYSYVEAKPIFDEIRKFAGTKVLTFDDHSDIFSFESTAILDANKLDELLSTYGYQTIFLNRTDNPSPTNMSEQ